MGTVAVLIALGAALGTRCGSSPGGDTSSLGATVQINAGGSETPAGVTRSDYDGVVKALAARDDAGLAQLVADGRVVNIGQCATATLIDTALGGERQVRIVSDSTHPENEGRAVWVDTNWLKGAQASCP